VPNDTSAGSRARDTFHARLAAVQLVPPRDSMTLGVFLARYSSITGKPATRTFYGHPGGTRRLLWAGKLLRDIPRRGRRLAGVAGRDREAVAATVARRVIAPHVLAEGGAMEAGGREPFADVKGGHQSNDARASCSCRATIACSCECPDAEWKVIIALSRYGGCVAV